MRDNEREKPRGRMLYSYVIRVDKTNPRDWRYILVLQFKSFGNIEEQVIVFDNHIDCYNLVDKLERKTKYLKFLWSKYLSDEKA